MSAHGRKVSAHQFDPGPPLRVWGLDPRSLTCPLIPRSPACVERILRVLEARCGEDGYHYIVAGDNFEPFDGEEQNGASAVIDPVGRKGLERMAAADGRQSSVFGVCARRPDTIVSQHER